MKKILLGLGLFAAFFAAATLRADVRLPKTFSDNAVLQRDIPVKVWGWADAGEAVTVTFGDQTAKATADADGKWLVTLAAMPASCDGKDLVVAGKNKITFSNVVVGEVWVCGGQSNMEMPLNSWGQPRLACSDEEISGDYSFIRFNRASHAVADAPCDDLQTTGWLLCKEGVQKDCTAVGFHFAVRLHQETGSPVGLIDSNWGGSNINSWLPADGWKKVPELVSVKENYDADRAAGKPVADGAKFAGMFNAMLAPWVNYAIRGAIWYQGESNAGEEEFYYFKQKGMIEEWRALWGQGDFPFYWVQLANFTPPCADASDVGNWPGLRDGQTRCLEVVNTGQAVIIDVGEEKDIHPRDKFSVGNRLALWALAGIFGKDVEPQSPTFKSVKFEDGKAVITFDHVGGGLIVGKMDGRRPIIAEPDGKLLRFALAQPWNEGNELRWTFADAVIVDKETVVVSSPYVTDPAAVRYAWQMNPEGCNLYSAEGLPATPFRTDVNK